jgi:hypothetical protein
MEINTKEIIEDINKLDLTVYQLSKKYKVNQKDNASYKSFANI